MKEFGSSARPTGVAYISTRKGETLSSVRAGECEEWASPGSRVAAGGANTTQALQEGA